MNDLKGISDKIKNFFSGERRVRAVVTLGILGMALILLSQIFSGGKKAVEAVGTDYDSAANAEYVAALEKKLCDVLGSMEGVGRVKVMITLDSSAQTVYATEERTQTDQSEDITGEERKRTQQSGNSQTNYILVDRGSGQKEPLVSTRLEPTIKGVVVICPGADNRLVSVRITDVVTTVMNVGANRVCVVKGGA